MAHTIRQRFVALDLADPWLEVTRASHWRLMRPDRRGSLTLSIFPVAAGVTVDLPSVVWREREHRRRRDEIFAGASKRGPLAIREVLLDESTWTAGACFCVVTRMRWDAVGAARTNVRAREFDGSHHAAWTVSDGRYVVEATLGHVAEGDFCASFPECDAMLRSVRFEGPS